MGERIDICVSITDINGEKILRQVDISVCASVGVSFAGEICNVLLRLEQHSCWKAVMYVSI